MSRISDILLSASTNRLLHFLASHEVKPTLLLRQTNGLKCFLKHFGQTAPVEPWTSQSPSVSGCKSLRLVCMSCMHACERISLLHSLHFGSGIHILYGLRMLGPTQQRPLSKYWTVPYHGSWHLDLITVLIAFKALTNGRNKMPV